MAASPSMTVPAQRTTAGDERAMRRLISDELDAARDALEAVISVLCADPDIAKRHMSVLQSIDIIGQHHENLARMLRADDMAQAAQAITLDTFRDRMLAAIHARG